MSRARRAEDWRTDLANAKPVEAMVAGALGGDARIRDLRDCTESYDLDFRFTYRAAEVALDVKEKRQPYSRGVQALWTAVEERDLFIVDETVYRRIVWQGGGGYLAIRDVPGERWCIFGPWELTLGRRVRYGRWGQRSGQSFLKGKLLVDLAATRLIASDFSVDLVLRAIDNARAWRTKVEPYPIGGTVIPQRGTPPAAHTAGPASGNAS